MVPRFTLNPSRTTFFSQATGITSWFYRNGMKKSKVACYIFKVVYIEMARASANIVSHASRLLYLDLPLYCGHILYRSSPWVL